MRSFAYGALGTVAVFVLAVLLLLAWWTYNRAYDGEQAWQCLNKPDCIVQALPRPMRVPAEPPKPPEDQKPAKH